MPVTDEDTPRWDPQRRFADVAPATDRQVHMAGGARTIGDTLIHPILARLRAAELEVARLRAEAVERSVAVNLLQRGGSWGLPRPDGTYATQGLPYPTAPEV